MHFQTSAGNSSGPTALPFFILLSAFFTSPLKQFTFSLTTSASSVLGSLSFFSFISFLKYSFHLFNTASKLTITLPLSSFIALTCCTSFPALSLCLANLYNSFPPFCFQIIIRTFLCHRNCLLCLTFLFFVHLFTIFTSYFISCFLRLFLYFHALLYFLILPPCLHISFSFPKCNFLHSLSCFFSIFAVFSHSSGNPFSPPKILLTYCLNAL